MFCRFMPVMYIMYCCLENDSVEVAHLRLGQCRLRESPQHDNLLHNLNDLVEGKDVTILCSAEFIQQLLFYEVSSTLQRQFVQ